MISRSLFLVALLSLPTYAQDAKPVGVHGDIGCKKDPKKVARLEITKPGVYENILVDGQWGTGNRVKITADDVTLRNCEIFNCGGNGVGVFAKNCIIENCKIHHCLKSTFAQQQDAHGITGGWNNLTIRNCEVYYVSGDAVQFDPDRRTNGKVVIEDCTFWTGPLPVDAAGFKKGDPARMRSTPRRRRRRALRHDRALLLPWLEPADSTRQHQSERDVLVKVERILRDNEIAFRIRGPGAKGGANVEIKNCAIYDSAVGLRIEDRPENLKIDKLGVGKGVGKKYHILKNQTGPGFENRGEYEAPSFEALLKQGFATTVK